MGDCLGENLGAPSANKILRQLKRQEHGLFNCVASVIADAAFVQEVAAMHPQLPVLPNLRCGAWYVPRADATCYFKSMDGHAGRWAFSLTRLNLQLAELAAAAGGAFVVDATRRGKTFPDALTKTIPIWAAVLNRAIARVHAQQLESLQQTQQSGQQRVHAQQPESLQQVQLPGQQTRAHTSRASGSEKDGDSTANSEPPQAGADEAQSGSDCGGSCDTFESSSADGAGVVGGSIAVLGKQPELLSGSGQPAEAGSAGDNSWDTALHLPLWISAGESAQIETLLSGFVDQLHKVGADVSGLASRLRKPLRPLWLSPASRMWVNHAPDLEELPFTPLFLVSASSPKRCRRTLGASSDGAAAAASFEYVPGAGDDEEGWARGLTPALLWAHCAELLAAGPDGIADAVAALLAQGGSAAGRSAARPALQTASPHRPQPLGCAAPPASTCRLPPAACSTGTRWLGGTGIGLVQLQEAGSSLLPELWRHADAVLDLSSSCRLPDNTLTGAEGPASAAGGVGSSRGSSTVALCAAASCSPTVNGNGGGGGRTQQRQQQRQQQYLWLEVRSAKAQRGSLLKALPAALRFIARQLAARGRVLIASSDGLNAPACIAVAALLAFFEPPLDGGAGRGGNNSGSANGWVIRDGVVAAVADAGVRDRDEGGGSAGSIPLHIAAAVGKPGLRRCLAFISSQCPEALPSQGMLKQVFSHFQIASGSNRHFQRQSASAN